MLDKCFELDDAEISVVSGGKYEGPCFLYVMKNGDTISTVATKYGTTEEIIIEINKIKNPKDIKTGDKILIPYKE